MTTILKLTFVCVAAFIGCVLLALVSFVALSGFGHDVVATTMTPVVNTVAHTPVEAVQNGSSVGDAAYFTDGDWLEASVASSDLRRAGEILGIAAGAMKAGGVGTPKSAAYRYVSPSEAKVAKQTGVVPNVSQAGKPKNVFYSPERYTSASEAEDALRIGSKNPINATTTPTHRITVDATKPNWRYGGNVEGSTGTELVTTEELRVLRIDPLGR